MPEKGEKPRKPRKKSTAISANFATKVGNGSALLLDGNLDGRSLAARRFRELTLGIASDLGGADALSVVQGQLVKRFCGAAVLAEMVEASIVKGEKVDIGQFATLINSQNRLASTLGVRRAVIDATPTLEAYLAARAAEAPGKPEDDEGGADGE